MPAATGHPGGDAVANTHGEEGTGAEAVSITSMRDALLDAQIAAEGSVAGSLNSSKARCRMRRHI